MPQKYIKVPEAIALKDPETGTPLLFHDKRSNTVSFKEIIHKLMHNPMWNESYPNIRSADAINKALVDAEENESEFMVLAEEDWKKLELAVQSPKQAVIVNGVPTIQMGYGFHPAMTPQLLPLLDPIVNALSTIPEEAATDIKATKE